MGIGRRVMCVLAVCVAHLCLADPVDAGDDPVEEEGEQQREGREQPRQEGDMQEEPEGDTRKPPRPRRTPPPPVLPPDEPTDVSTKTPGGIIRAPSSTSVLRKQEDIQGSGARYPSDVLRLVPGVEVQRVYSTLSNVSVRGFNETPATAQGVLALIDGRRAYNEFLGNPLWDQLMLIPEDIEQIQVIRGPGSFLHGPNAMHGLVLFETKSPLDYAESEVSALGAIGSYDSNLGRVRGVMRDTESGSGLLVNLVYDDIDQFQPPETDTRDKIYGEVRYEKDLGGGSRGDGEKSTHLFEVGAGLSDQKFDMLLQTLDLIPGTQPIPSDTYASRAQELYVTARYELDQLVARATWTAFDSTADSTMGIYAPFDMNLNTVDLDVHGSFDLLDKRHKVTVGGGYRFATIETEDLDVTVGRHSTNLLSAFLQDEITLVPESLFLTVGVRLDHHSEAGSNVAPRAALVWTFRQDQSLRASYGRGHRNPNLMENWLSLPLMLPLGTATVLGNRDLEAERMDSFELGYRGWFEFDDRELMVGVTGYRNFIDDLVVYEMVGPATVAPVNQDEYRAYGVELEAEYTLTRSLTAFGNYSYGILEDRGEKERVLTAPKNKANLGVRYRGQIDETRVDAMLWLTYFDDTEFNFPGGAVDDYLLLNASVYFEFAPGRRAFMKVFNLLDNDHSENPEGHEYGRILTVGFTFTW